MKCEFDTDVKIENQITMMESNYFFIKKVRIKTQGKKKDVLEIFIWLGATIFTECIGKMLQFN